MMAVWDSNYWLGKNIVLSTSKREHMDKCTSHCDITEHHTINPSLPSFCQSANGNKSTQRHVDCILPF